ncbi:hypothetical protein ABT174_08395 [Streptomyces sparsogenes]|uniref:hypothetical protein n=1 Tax=Streptomyces sparsogenes TaxID=67365 RepID=UPI00331694CE
MVTRRARWWAAALLMAALTGCGSAADTSSSPGAKGAPEVTDEKDLPPLPLDRYRLGADESRRWTKAQQRLAQRCMVGLGFTDFPADPKPPSGPTASATLTITALPTPLGRLDLDKAERWGYGWDPKVSRRRPPEPAGREMTDREFAALYGRGGGRDTPSGRKPPEQGCSGQANRRLLKGVEDNTRMWTYVSRRDAALHKAVMKDRKVRRAFATWSKCVTDKGGERYPDPLAAYGAKAWGRGKDGNTTHTRREVRTAVADVECKREHNTVGVWWDTATERQRADIQRNKATYEAVRDDLDTLRGNIREALG